MASNLTTTIKNRILDWEGGVGSPVRPVSPQKVILFTTMPNQQTGVGGVQPTGFGYAPTTVTWSAAASGATSNSADVVFPLPTGGNWGIILGIGIQDSSGTPLLLWTAAFVTPRTVNDGQEFRIVAGAITKFI